MFEGDGLVVNARIAHSGILSRPRESAKLSQQLFGPEYRFMKKRRNLTSADSLPATAGAPGRLKRMVTALALPSMLGACAAHAPHATPPSHQTAQHAKGGHLAPARQRPKDYDWLSLSRLSVEPTLRLPSEIVVVESILARKQAEAERAQASEVPIQTRHGRWLSGKKQDLAYRHAAPVARQAVGKGGAWERVRRGLMLASEEHERVQAEVDAFKRSPGSFSILTRNAEPFLSFVSEEIERRGLPLDLVALPMIESGYQTAAVSPRNAGGLWQLMPQTGQEHGVKLTDDYDGRFDVHASTSAALSYLSHLKSVYRGDWLLVLAAYNAGEGTVNRALEANRKAGKSLAFWDLNLPAETMAYVPKFLALSQLIADPQRHGLRLPKSSALPVLARVQVNGEMPLEAAPAAAGMESEEFFAFNPAFKPGATLKATHSLLLPLDRAEAFVAQMPQAKLVSARHYVVKKGDTLVVIAKRHGVPQTRLALWNGLKTDSPVKPGQQLEIFPISRT